MTNAAVERNAVEFYTELQKQDSIDACALIFKGAMAQRPYWRHGNGAAPRLNPSSFNGGGVRRAVRSLTRYISAHPSRCRNASWN